MSSAATYGKGAVGFLKKWWDLKPEFVACGVLTIVGLSLGAYAVNSYYTNNLDNRKYRTHYTVYRHDDPRVEKLRKD